MRTAIVAVIVDCSIVSPDPTFEIRRSGKSTFIINSLNLTRKQLSRLKMPNIMGEINNATRLTNVSVIPYAACSLSPRTEYASPSGGPPPADQA